ncbi:MAG: APC family permease [Planctomycetota bacterium]|nr:MAG: APC family permease [Planctomycetota bacterium]
MLLFLFAVLVRQGISESAAVALGIFILHMATLVSLVLVAGYFVVTDPGWGSDALAVLERNLRIPIGGAHGHIEGFVPLAEADWGTILGALVFGFGTGLLGISGFESSANFVEEQQPGVFVKTLRNMWVAVSVFNPLIALLALGVLPLEVITAKENSEQLLAVMAQAGAHEGGRGLVWGGLKTLVIVDATLVLSGAVLTSYVGVTGLVRRMALDRCLPQALLKENRRGTNGRIIFGFFLLCTSIAWVTGGDVRVLGGVYTIAFLGVMALFATGNILMKIYRSRLKRDVKASWAAVITALVAVLAGIVVNVIADPAYPGFFLMYFLPTMTVIGFMFIRTRVLKLGLAIIEGLMQRINAVTRRWRNALLDKIDEINSLGIIFFTRGDDVSNLNRAMLYVRANEETKRVKIVHVYRDEKEIPERLQADVEYLDRVYPEIDIEFVKIKGTFSPELVDRLSKQFQVPKNYMFIGAPGERFPHNLAEFGGVRVII